MDPESALYDPKEGQTIHYQVAHRTIIRGRLQHDVKNPSRQAPHEARRNKWAQWPSTIRIQKRKMHP